MFELVAKAGTVGILVQVGNLCFGRHSSIRILQITVNEFKDIGEAFNRN